MNRIQQAIFTSVDVNRETDYQLVGGSDGLCEADARELAVWGPACDGLLDVGPDAESLNFHPLPSGAYCLSRTIHAGWQQGGGQRLHTHCLIVPTEVLARFANNPIALNQTISERGYWCGPAEANPELEPFSLAGGAPPVDTATLRQLTAELGPQRVAALIQAARDAVCLALVGRRPIEPLLAGLFGCLPPECRLEFSFSTGLKFSPRRPFRILSLSDDPAERLWIANHPNVAVLDIHQEPAAPLSLDGWSRLIERSLATNHLPFLAAQLSRRRFDLAMDDLPALGLQLLENLDATEIQGVAPVDSYEMPNASSATTKPRAHAAHRQFEKSLKAATLSVPSPSAELGLESPEVLEKLEHLDDLVYEAISGQTGSLELLRTAWPKLLEELGETRLAASREQYLRYALSIWQECAEVGEIRNPHRAIQALDVLCLLFSDMA
ncbi:MAG: hypothetical protein LLF97_08220 [Planctomycetaceae bacterium]|nr:hypothetical protein [Planctomycetaceae bacterium]